MTFERLDLQFPNGEKHDSETLMVHPLTGDLYVVIKTGFTKKSAVFKASAPLSALATNPLVKIADLAVPAGLDLPITSGDIHPCGTAVLLRAYNTVYQFELPPGSAFDTVFTSSFTRVPAPPVGLGPSDENAGEAISWSPDGRGYFTASEGANQQLHFVGCP